MIISNSHKFISIHIPKCGGTTVSKFFERRLKPQDITLNLNPHDGWKKYLDSYQKRFGLFKHSTGAEIANAMGPKSFKTYSVIAFVRNPFARAFSAFTFTKLADGMYRPESERYQEIKDMDFDQFVETKYMQEKLILPAQQQQKWIKNPHLEVETYRLEELEKNLGLLSQRFYGENVAHDIKRSNTSSEPESWRSMSSRAEEAIRELYSDDFDFLGYANRIDRKSV